MATTRKRGNSYQIRVSCGYDIKGKQVVYTKNWTPAPGLSKRELKKQLDREIIKFEDACMSGAASHPVKLSEFIPRWEKEHAQRYFKLTTLDSMSTVIKRIDKELGHLYLDKITKRTVRMFVELLLEGSKINPPLGSKTVKNHIAYLSSIFQYAISLEMVQNNPCSNIKIPHKRKQPKDIYTVEEAQLFLDTLIQKAPIMYQCYFLLAIYGGFRRGELCGLTWDDIDFDTHIISITKALYHIKRTGNVVDTPKSEASCRYLKMPDELFPFLERLKEHYISEGERLGNQWHESNSLFRRPNGETLSPLAPNEWLHKFCNREGLRYVVPHSFRHFNASLLIDSGASVKTVQTCLGHSSASTTLDIYSHAFSRAQAIASQAVASNFKLLKDTQSNNDDCVKDK